MPAGCDDRVQQSSENVFITLDSARDSHERLITDLADAALAVSCQTLSWGDRLKPLALVRVARGLPGHMHPVATVRACVLQEGQSLQ